MGNQLKSQKKASSPYKISHLAPLCEAISQQNSTKAKDYLISNNGCELVNRTILLNANENRELVRGTPLHCALVTQNIHLVKLICSFGGNVNQPLNITKNSTYISSLGIILSKPTVNVELVRYLCFRGVDLTDRRGWYRTDASTGWPSTIAVTLVEFGMQVNMEDLIYNQHNNETFKILCKYTTPSVRKKSLESNKLTNDAKSAISKEEGTIKQPNALNYPGAIKSGIALFKKQSKKQFKKYYFVLVHDGILLLFTSQEAVKPTITIFVEEYHSIHESFEDMEEYCFELEPYHYIPNLESIFISVISHDELNSWLYELRPIVQRNTIYSSVTENLAVPSTNLNTNQLRNSSVDIMSYIHTLNLLSDTPLDADIPDEFLDPITQEVMKDPVSTKDGHVYERSSIELWFKDHDTSPNTGLKLDDKSLTPNHQLKQQITQWRNSNQYKDR